MRRIARKRLFWWIYTGAIYATAVSIAYFGYWRPFYSGYRSFFPHDLTPPRHVDQDTMLRLGSLRADRTSSFPRFELQKKSGVVRVCALGDSFTYGDEVADGHDFPALLQDLFRKRGFANVEVLNFGNSWYGFHQTFIVWDGIARHFGCDYILLGPACFQPERDMTFNHAVRTSQAYFLHARYVIEDGDVRRWDVIGRTARERFDAYFSFVPAWRYLRFDRNPPALFLALLGPDHAVNNFFYYDDRPEAAEAYETYRLLLRRMARESHAQILLLHSLPPIVELAQSTGEENIVALSLPRYERFPYGAIGGHYSAFGNRLMAEHYYSYLVDSSPPPTFLEFDDTAGGEALGVESERPPLSDYERIDIVMAGQQTGFLARTSFIPGERVGSPTDLHGTDVAALLALKEPGTSIVDAGFVPLAKPLRGDEELALRIDRPQGSEQRTLGRVRLLNAAANIAVVEVPGMQLGDGELRVNARTSPSLEHADGGELTYLLDSIPILRQRSGDGDGISLQPNSGWLRVLRPGEGQSVDLDGLAESGVVSLQLHGGDRGITEIPLAHWSKRAGALPPASPNLRRLSPIAAVPLAR